MHLARDLELALDPCEFARACGIEPDRWQADLLTGGHQRALLNCARQTGKSTVTAIAALHTAVFEGPALVLLLSPSQRQSSELFRKVTELFHRLPNAPEIHSESVLRLGLRNGSRIIALPGNESTVRGYSAARLIVLDEAARVPDDLLAAVRPILATSTGGRFIALSTPHGKRGWFYSQWVRGDGWHRIRVAARACKRIAPEFLEHERAELGEMLFSQEYECAFVDDETSAFSSELIEAAFSDDVRPLFSVAA